MKKFGKQIVAMSVVSVMVLSCFAGCGKSDDAQEKGTSTKDIEISYWNSGLGTDWLDAMIEGFEKAHPEYNVYYTANADAAAVASGLGLEDVDSVDLYLGLTETSVSSLEPLDDVLDAVPEGETKSIREKMNSGYLSLVQEDDGKTYNLTYGGGMLSFVYNKKLFEQAGIEQIPRTTDELAFVCNTLRKKDIVPLCHFVGGGYYDFLSEAFYMQYEGKDYYMDNFYGCTDEKGTSPSKEVFSKKDGRYEVLKAYEKFITPENVLQGSNSGQHVTVQTMFVNGEAAIMASGSWLVNEMKSTGNLDHFDMMRLPVISSITDKLQTVKKESDLRKLIDAIDSVLDGEKTADDYKTEGGYAIDDLNVSEEDWEYVYAARTTSAINYSGESMFIPNYCNAKEGAKEFIKYFYSDEGYQIFASTLHSVLPMSLGEGELDTSDWNEFEKNQLKYLATTTQFASYYNTGKHTIFSEGGASLFANVQFINYFCTKNEADRMSANDAWEKVMQEVDNNYESTWLANIK